MKLASFVHDNEVSCGFLKEDSFILLDSHPDFKAVPKAERIFTVLKMKSEERRNLYAELEGAPRIGCAEVKMLPAIPYSPLYIYNHANNPTVWKRQTPREWNITRLPYLRVRPLTSFGATGGKMPVCEGGRMAMGSELGVVIGAEAENIKRENAAFHIAGLILLNDAYAIGRIEDFLEEEGAPGAGNQDMGIATLRKNADISAGTGPWVALTEDLEDDYAAKFISDAGDSYTEKNLLPWLYNQTMHTFVGEELKDESWTGSYLYGAEWTVWFLSQFMKLQTGSIIGLGAAGWDGCHFDLDEKIGSQVECRFSIPAVGTLKQIAVRTSRKDLENSQYCSVRESAGLSELPEIKERGGRSLWVLRGNYSEASDSEGMISGEKMNTICFPSVALKDDTSDLIIPAHAQDLKVSVHLAAEIGSKPAYGLTPENALQSVKDLRVMLQVRDTSFNAELNNPDAYEGRAAWFLGCCGTGFFRLGSLLPVDTDCRDIELQLKCGNGENKIFKTENYFNGLEDALTLITRMTTLLPGDIVSLGVAGPEVTIAANEKIESLVFSAVGDEEISIPVNDNRDPEIYLISERR
ncbi:MAG: fumarylacetoacetate hydrolase family protein [Planctomycetota bacterium]|jgi:2-keto-4-pentenoate hydratase/2-oxohepta-3-ene-1,7-dioic acid hydratase in catechol pathway